MKVKIVSGNQAGIVQDLPQVEAEAAVATGYAVPVAEESADLPAAAVVADAIAPAAPVADAPVSTSPADAVPQQ